MNTIDDINRTEPNQMLHIKKKIRNNNKFENKYNLSNEKNKMKRKISKNMNIQKNIHLNTNNFIKKQKINFNENKVIDESNYEKSFNKTSNDFNNFKYSIVNQMDVKYKNIFNSNNEQNSRNIITAVNNNIKIKNNKNIISHIDKKPNVTIKNTVINLNIDTGFIIHSFDKRDKIKSINSSRPNNYLINEIDDNNNRYLHKNKNNNYLNQERISTNIIHHNTNENQFQVINTENNILTENNNISGVNKTISKKKIIYKDDKNLKINNEKNFLNKSMNNNIKRHIKYKSMKLEDKGSNKFYKKDINHLYLKTNENFFKY